MEAESKKKAKKIRAWPGFEPGACHNQRYRRHLGVEPLGVVRRYEVVGGLEKSYEATIIPLGNC
jgi:hypothetical protein